MTLSLDCFNFPRGIKSEASGNLHMNLKRSYSKLAVKRDRWNSPTGEEGKGYVPQTVIWQWYILTPTRVEAKLIEQNRVETLIMTSFEMYELHKWVIIFVHVYKIEILYFHVIEDLFYVYLYIHICSSCVYIILHMYFTHCRIYVCMYV